MIWDLTDLAGKVKVTRLILTELDYGSMQI